MRWVVGPQDFCAISWHFENGASSKIDDVLAEDGELLRVLSLAVHLSCQLQSTLGFLGLGTRAGQ